MRRIASNYIYLPGFPLVRYGYLLWDGGLVGDVVETGGVLKEFHGLEFYGGMIVAGEVRQGDISGLAHQAIIPFLDRFYSHLSGPSHGLSIIKRADLKALLFLEETVVEPLIV